MPRLMRKNVGGDDGDLGSEGDGGGKGVAKEEAHNELATDEPPPGDEDARDDNDQLGAPVGVPQLEVAFL